MTPTPETTETAPAPPAPPTPSEVHARALAERDQAAADRDQARAEHRDLFRADAVTRLAAAAGADPDRLLDSTAFVAEYDDLGRDPSDADVTAAIERTLTAQPALRSTPLPVRRPPRAAGGQGSAEITAQTTADRRAAQAADQSPQGRIAAEFRRVADKKSGHHR